MTIFSASFDAHVDAHFDAGAAEVVGARDARSAAWMAAGWAAVTGRAGRVATVDPDERALAHLVADRARLPMRIGSVAELIGAIDELHPPPAGVPAPHPAPIDEWARIDARPIRLERLAADLVAVLPRGAVVCIESPRLETIVLAAAAVHPSVLAIARLSGASRGAAIAWAVGAKVAAPQRAVVAITDAAGFAIGGMDLATAARRDTPVAVVVANEERAVPAFELVAPIAGGHGEQVTEPSRLAIHLRNAMSVTIPAVINVAVEPASDRTLARR